MSEQEPSVEFVLAELTPGKISIGLRIGGGEYVEFIRQWATMEPKAAAQVIADIRVGKISLDAVARMSYVRRYFPLNEKGE